ncbi:Clp protease N-terminal domain-containing protein [Propionicicella superfundia]|uniref:Clp protease N-terminal domain-containing protein n=1 Tax=Propionicicella superfundia TaxID=348582 RepID=UPI000406FABA|nr:Clp protease N-terminal domain-containing protein [Propionicicella superfundia]
MFERFTKDARRMVKAAEESARAAGSPSFGCAHLLWALTEPGSTVRDVLAAHGITPEVVAVELGRTPAGGLDASALAALGIDLDAVRASVEETFGPGALDDAAGGGSGRPRAGGRPRFTDGAKKALELSLREAIRLHADGIDPAVLLLGVVRADDARVNAVLTAAGTDAATLRGDVEQRLRRSA